MEQYQQQIQKVLEEKERLIEEERQRMNDLNEKRAQDVKDF